MHRLQIKWVFPFLVLLWALPEACTRSSSRLDVDVSGLFPEKIRIHRYEQALFSIPPGQLEEGLEKIRPEFMFFLDTDLSDPATLAALREYLANARTGEFCRAVETRFPELAALEKSLAEAFRHYHYHFPAGEVPRVYTYISGGEYEFPVQWADSVLLIALDSYLGKEFKLYAADGVPVYRMRRMEPENILPDCIRSLQHACFPVRYPGNTLLDHMVDAGKRIYFVDAMLPGYPDRLKLNYTADQMNWIVENEPHVWAAIIENRLLYSTQANTIRTFLADGPFTADFSAESPPRLGEYLGWRIVTAYMERNPDIALRDLIRETDAQKILTGSRYKPRK